jgi:hypothetical protein
MKNVINTVMWVVLFLFLLPSSLAVASWNSLPGTRLFGVKLAMEQALVVVSPSAEMKGSLQIHYTQRRFAEAQTLLTDQTSAKGLVYLDSQVRVTKQQIVAATDPVVKRDLAQKYIVALQTVSTQLEEQKQVAVAAVSQPTPTPVPPTPTAVIQPTQKVTLAPMIKPSVPTLTPTPTPSVPSIGGVQPPTPESIVVSITTSQQEINQTIEDMQKISDEFEHGNNDKSVKQENKGNTNENKVNNSDRNIKDH